MDEIANIPTGAEPPIAPVITSRQVIREGRPVLFAARSIEDDTLVLLDADTIDSEDELVATLEELLRRDPAIQELVDLAPGWQAQRRSRDEPWIRYPRCC